MRGYNLSFIQDEIFQVMYAFLRHFDDGNDTITASTSSIEYFSACKQLDKIMKLSSEGE